MFKLIYLIFVIIIKCNGKIEIPIGGIFHEKGDIKEIAFLSTIEDINDDERFIEFIPQVRYLESDNGFDAGNIVCELAGRGVAAIFGPFSKNTIPITESICSRIGIPHFIGQWMPEPIGYSADRPNCMTLNLYPESRVLAEAYKDFIRFNSWKGYTLIYETDEDLMKMKEILQFHNPDDKPITVRQIDPDNDNYRPLLKQIKTTGLGNWDIILQCDSEKIIDLLKQAFEVGLTGEYQRFFLTHPDSSSLDFNNTDVFKTNITSLRLINPGTETAKKVTELWNEYARRNDMNIRVKPEQIKVEPALLYDALKIFTATIKDFVSRDEYDIPSIDCNDPKQQKWRTGMKMFKQIKEKKGFDGLTGYIRFDEEGSRSEFEMEVVEFKTKYFNKSGTWSSETNEIITVKTPSEFVEESQNSLSNKVVKVVSKIGKPFLMMKESVNGVHLEGNAQYEGFCMDLIDEISKLLNFTYRFELVPDKNYGKYDPVKKEWDGIVRHVMDRKADMGICDLTITYERRTAVDFSLPFMDLGISILFVKPPEPVKDLFAFLLPFAPVVWLWIAVAILFMTFCFFWLGRISDDEWVSPHPCNPDNLERENVWVLKNCTWLVIGSLMGQGCDLLPKGISSRIACGSMWFFALIMLASYTANLAAFLTMVRMESTIENVEQLAEQSKIKYGAVTGGSTLKFFENSNNSLYQKMYTVMQSARPSVFTKDNDEGADRVLKSKRLYAFLMESSVIEYRTERDCDLVQIGRPLDSKFYGIALPMNSGYRKLINKAILKLQEHGKLQTLKQKWWKEMHGGGQCDDNEVKDNSQELNIHQVGGVFVILLCGLGIGLTIGVLEFLWNVKDIAVMEKITPWQALKKEVKFAIQVKNGIKPVKHEAGSTESHSTFCEQSYSSSLERQN